MSYTFLKGINSSNGWRGLESSTVSWVYCSHFESAAVILQLLLKVYMFILVLCRWSSPQSTINSNGLPVGCAILKMTVADSKWLWQTQNDCGKIKWLWRTRVLHSHLMNLYLLEKYKWKWNVSYAHWSLFISNIWTAQFTFTLTMTLFSGVVICVTCV